MAHWDRRALLSLIENTGKRAHAPELSAAQRNALHALMAHYGDKAKTIRTSPHDVLSMQGQLTQILDLGDGDA
jgi:hypothetical protein